MASYYVKNAGDDAKDGLSNANAWETISKVDGESYSAGDNIYFNRGDTWREQLNPPSSGSSNSPITFGTYGTGSNPIISGADLRTGWADQGSNVWDDALTTEPEKVFFNGTQGTLAASKVAISSTNEWFWAGDVLSIYSTSDPDTAFTNPGIEAIARTQCIDVRQSYITIDGIDCTMAKDDNIRFLDSGAEGWTDCIAKNLTTDHSAGKGIWFNINNLLIDNIISASNGVSGFDHGIYVSDYNGAFASNYVVQYVTAIDNFGAGITMGDAAGGIVRYNNCYGGQWGIHTSNNVAGETIEIYYNLLHDTVFTSGNGDGIKILDENSDVTINVYNNTIYNCGRFGIHGDNNASAAAIVIKNNIVLDSTSEDLYQPVVGTSNYTMDNNCYYRSSGDMIRWAGNTYTQAQFASYQSTESQDANSISEDPLFIAAASGDFKLQNTSPAIETGTSVGLSQDYSGNPVPMGNAPDIGAYEYPFSIGRYHGRKAALYIDNASGACQNVSGDTTSITANFSLANPETTRLEALDTERVIRGSRDHTLEISGIYSEGTTSCIMVLLRDMYSASAIRRVQYFPTGRFIGYDGYTASMRMEQFSVISPTDNVSVINGTLELASGTVASPTY